MWCLTHLHRMRTAVRRHTIRRRTRLRTIARIVFDVDGPLGTIEVASCVVAIVCGVASCVVVMVVVCEGVVGGTVVMVGVDG